MGKKKAARPSPRRKSPPRKASVKPSTKPRSKGEVPARNTASSEQLAKLFSCTTRQIELLAKKGIAVRVGHGRYDPVASTTNYIVHLREQAAARVGQDPNADAVAASAEFRTEQREYIRTRRLKLQGDLIEVAKVRDAWAQIIRLVRQSWLALPGKIAFEVPSLTLHDKQIIERIVKDDLEDAALARGYRSIDKQDDVPG
jgi:phage terminase Nu1 subunit (DNA packaging protein)